VTASGMQPFLRRFNLWVTLPSSSLLYLPRRVRAAIELPRMVAAEWTLLRRCAAVTLAASAECDWYQVAFAGVIVRCIPNGRPALGQERELSLADDQLIYVGNLYYSPNLEGLVWF